MSDWEDYRVFRAVMRWQAYGLAGAALGLTPATVRARMRRLSDQLGATLFVHAPEGLTPTAAALRLRLIAEEMEAAAGAFERMASAGVDALQGRVKVAVFSEILVGVELIVPALRALRERHPGLSVELGFQIDWRLLLAGAAEVLVRLDEPAHPELEGRSVGRLEQGLYVHRRYLDRAPLPSRLGGGLPLIASLDPELHRAEFARFGLSPGDVRVVFATDDRVSQMAAIRAGVGVGLCPVVIARADPDLIPVLPELTRHADLWVIVPKALTGVRRVAVLRDALVDHLTPLFTPTPAPLPQGG